MGICLMPHIEYQLVLRKIHGKMQRHGKLHRTEIRSQMSACLTDTAHQKASDFLRKLCILLLIHFFDIIGLIDFLQQSGSAHLNSLR